MVSFSFLNPISGSSSSTDTPLDGSDGDDKAVWVLPSTYLRFQPHALTVI